MTAHGALISPKLRHLGSPDLAGGGQVVVQGETAFMGHMKPPHGTTIIDVSDPRQPTIVAQIEAPSRWSHSHKVRVAGDVMITNVEQDRRHFLRRVLTIPQLSDELEAHLGRPPNDMEIAARMGVSGDDIKEMRAGLQRGYDEGGFRLWDISNPATPRLIDHQRTFGFGVHRFDMDQNFAYISTEMEGFIGNILVIYAIADPSNVHEVSRWWMPGQHVSGGETPHWNGYGVRLHHAMRVGDELWASVWHAGFRVIDIADITAPRTVGEHNYHPWVVEPTHSVLPAAKRFDGRRIAVACDEEHDHRHGQPHAGLWLIDVTDLSAITPLATFQVSESDSPWARARTFRHASVRRAHRRQSSILRLVFRWPEDRRYFRSVNAARRRLFHSRATAGPGQSAEQRCGCRRPWSDLSDRPQSWLRHIGI
jgi:hypothetical protein